MWDVSPILKEIRTRPQVEGHEASYQRESGEIIQIEYKEQSVEQKSQLEDAQGFAPEEFLQFAADIGEEMGKKMLSDLLTTVGKAATEVGNVVDFKGSGMTFEKFLDMIANSPKHRQHILNCFSLLLGHIKIAFLYGGIQHKL